MVGVKRAELHGTPFQHMAGEKAPESLCSSGLLAFWAMEAPVHEISLYRENQTIFPCSHTLLTWRERLERARGEWRLRHLHQDGFPVIGEDVALTSTTVKHVQQLNMYNQ